MCAEVARLERGGLSVALDRPRHLPVRRCAASRTGKLIEMAERGDRRDDWRLKCAQTVQHKVLTEPTLNFSPSFSWRFAPVSNEPLEELPVPSSGAAPDE